MTSDEDRFAHYATVTAEKLALLYLRDTLLQLEMSEREPIRLAEAAKSIHQALQAALTAALAGGMSIGAYSEKTEQQWLAFLQGDRATHKRSGHGLRGFT